MASSSSAKRRELEQETELRCDVFDSQTLSVKLVKGDAEVFGVEMVADREYKFKAENIAIFTWYGCTLEYTLAAADGTSMEDEFYTADKTPMVAYVNTHAQLEARRDVAESSRDGGPRVLVLGSKDSGKSTATRILASYAARLDRTPIYVDLDVGESGYGGVAGSIVAVPVDKSMLNVQEGLSSPLTPLVYFTGSATIKGSSKHFKHVVSLLGEKVDNRLYTDAAAFSSGIIINTPAEMVELDAASIENLLHVVRAFSVDVIFCMDAMGDRIFSRLNSLQSNKDIPPGAVIITLPSSKGIIPRSNRDPARRAQINAYFNGHRVTRGLSPSRTTLPLSKLVLLRVGGQHLSSAMRPIGSNEESTLNLTVVRPTADLARLLVAVLHAPPDTGLTGTTDDEVPAELMNSNVGGFLSILEIDVERDELTVLAPCPTSLENLPSRYLLVGNVTYSD